IPRKVQIALIDDTDDYATRAELDAALAVSGGTPNVRATLAGTPGTDGDFKVYTLKISAAADNPYLLQTATVENVTLGLRWSGDVIVRAGGVTDVTLTEILVR